MKRTPNNGPTFTKKPSSADRVEYARKKKPLRIQGGRSKSAKTGNLKRWSRW